MDNCIIQSGRRIGGLVDFEAKHKINHSGNVVIGKKFIESIQLLIE